MLNHCAIVAPRNPEKQAELLANQLFVGTMALPFVIYCVSSRDRFYSDPNTPRIKKSPCAETCVVGQRREAESTCKAVEAHEALFWQADSGIPSAPPKLPTGLLLFFQQLSGADRVWSEMPHFFPVNCKLLAPCSRIKRKKAKKSARKEEIPAINSEPFAIGPVQFSWPRGVAENWFTKPKFWEDFVSFCLGETAKHRVHWIFFSPDPGNLLNLIFWDWPRSGRFLINCQLWPSLKIF